jgi:hypothetical protein
VVNQVVRVHIGLDGRVRVYAHEQLLVEHQLQPATQGWVTLPAHHAALWQAALGAVEQRPLAIYEEVGRWS